MILFLRERVKINVLYLRVGKKADKKVDKKVGWWLRFKQWVKNGLRLRNRV